MITKQHYFDMGTAICQNDFDRFKKLVDSFDTRDLINFNYPLKVGEKVYTLYELATVVGNQNITALCIKKGATNSWLQGLFPHKSDALCITKETIHPMFKDNTQKQSSIDKNLTFITNEQYLKLLGAIYQDDFKRVKMYVDSFGRDKKIDFNRHFLVGCNKTATLFEIAIALGNEDIVAFFVQKGADFQGWHAKNPPLVQAAMAGHLNLVRFFCEKGCYADKCGQHSRTALDYAVENGDLEMVKCLIEHRAYVNGYNDKRNPLNVAAMNGYTDIVEYLIEKGAWINQVSDKGYTALMFAAMEGHMDVVRMLVVYGADIHKRNKRNLTAMGLAYSEKQLQVGRWLHDIQLMPEKFQKELEQHILSIPEDKLLKLPQTHPRLSQQLYVFQMFERINKLLPYENQVKFYKVFRPYMNTKTRQNIQNRIRFDRARSV